MQDVIFLLDVDNTLLDNDRFGSDLTARLESEFGVAGRESYWAGFEKIRSELEFADYLGALQMLRVAFGDDPKFLGFGSFLLDYPFAERLHLRALDVIAHLSKLGPTVVLSDGDVVFQPRKVQCSGIWDAVQGRVLIYIHKQDSLLKMQQRFPARHYVMVDDKPQILADMKKVMGSKLTTVFVRQGHYAVAQMKNPPVPAPDRIIDVIGDLMDFDFSLLVDKPVS